MPRYRDTKTGRMHRTNAGSFHDKRLSASKRYQPVDEPAQTSAGEPARNASRDDWAAYAAKVANDPSEVAAIEGLTRDELVEVFGGRGAVDA